jgi:hypothetical protein
MRPDEDQERFDATAVTNHPAKYSRRQESHVDGILAAERALEPFPLGGVAKRVPMIPRIPVINIERWNAHKIDSRTAKSGATHRREGEKLR